MSHETQTLVQLPETCPLQTTDVALSKSIPSFLGRLTKIVYGEQTIFQLHLSSEIINNYIPQPLQAFTGPITLKDRIKRDLVYSPPLVSASRAQLSDDIQHFSSSVSLDDLFEQLLPNPNDVIRYNFVILGDCLVLARIPHTYKLPYYLLCKHITLANRSTDVRFAGELWRDEHHGFRLNNNSGTYQPSKTLIEPTVALFNRLIPSLQVTGVTFEESALPPTCERFKLSLRWTVLCGR